MTPTRDEELRALRRPFAIGVACVVLVIVLLGLVIARFGSNADRPAGIAERWLVAVGDSTREGIEDDARDRLQELSSSGLHVADVDALLDLPSDAEDGESRFESIRVGPPLDDGLPTNVPAVVTPRGGDPAELLVLVVGEGGDRRVVAATLLDEVSTSETGALPGEALDSIGGFPIERPERAPIGWFVGALLLGGLITVGCVAAVRAATPKSD